MRSIHRYLVGGVLVVVITCGLGCTDNTITKQEFRSRFPGCKLPAFEAAEPAAPAAQPPGALPTRQDGFAMNEGARKAESTDRAILEAQAAIERANQAARLANDAANVDVAAAFQAAAAAEKMATAQRAAVGQKPALVDGAASDGSALAKEMAARAAELAAREAEASKTSMEAMLDNGKEVEMPLNLLAAPGPLMYGRLLRAGYGDDVKALFLVLAGPTRAFGKIVTKDAPDELKTVLYQPGQLQILGTEPLDKSSAKRLFPVLAAPMELVGLMVPQVQKRDLPAAGEMTVVFIYRSTKKNDNGLLVVDIERVGASGGASVQYDMTGKERGVGKARSKADAKGDISFQDP